MFGTKKGQAFVQLIIAVVVAIVVTLALTPTIITSINTAGLNGSALTLATNITLFVVILLIGLIVSALGIFGGRR